MRVRMYRFFTSLALYIDSPAYFFRLARTLLPDLFDEGSGSESIIRFGNVKMYAEGVYVDLPRRAVIMGQLRGQT